MVKRNTRYIATRKQRVALKAVYDRNSQCTQNCTYLEFRRRAFWAVAGDCLMIPWAGMMLGIEPDGYTHS